jgi:serine/threonine-protein kinase
MTNKSNRLTVAVLLLPLVLSACVVRTPDAAIPSPAGQSSGKSSGAGTKTGGTSAASKVVTVPDLSDRSRSFARDVLKQLDLRVGGTSYRADERSRGLVIRTEPESGEQVRPGTRIDLVVSKGPGDAETEPVRVEVEDHVGRPDHEARSGLERLGLKVEVLPRQASDPAALGTVLEQRPVGGTQVWRGATVTLVVGAGSGDPPPTADPTASPTALPTEG